MIEVDPDGGERRSQYQAEHAGHGTTGDGRHQNHDRVHVQRGTEEPGLQPVLDDDVGDQHHDEGAHGEPEARLIDEFLDLLFVDPVPADAFFSLTLYDADQYLMSDEYNMVSSNRSEFISRPDGGFDVIFGGMDCKAIADERGVNFAYTPADGWNWLLRAYRPDVEAMKQYRMPELERVD